MNVISSSYKQVNIFKIYDSCYRSFCLIFWYQTTWGTLGIIIIMIKCKLGSPLPDCSGVNTQNSFRKLLSGVSEKVIKETSWLKCIWMTRTHSCCVSKSQTYFIRTIQLVCYFYLLIINTLWYGLFPLSSNAKNLAGTPC